MYVTIRIKATGQITEMVPDVARAMISSGMAEEVKAQQPETMITRATEHAVAPAQSLPAKPARSRRAG